MATFGKTFNNFALLGLIIFGILAFVITLQVDNNASDQLRSNKLINSTYSDLETNLGDMRNQTQNQREIFESESPTVTFGSLILFSVVSSGKVFTSMVVGVFNIIINLPVVLFGVDSVVISVLSAIFLVGIIIALWVLYKLGG